LRDAREIFEREYLLAQVNRFGGNISRTAEFVGMERSALHRKLRALGVNSNEGARPYAKVGREVLSISPLARLPINRV
jgi:two-component system nitrogen regulation response regulator NtrX